MRYDQVAFKGSHNSIDRKPAILAQLAGAGLVERCCALELDLVQDENEFVWRVQHGAGDDGPPLKKILKEIAGWSRDTAEHTVLTIHLDLKNAPLDHAEFADAMDELLVGVFGRRRIYSPASVIGTREDLVRGARAGGWATIEALKGKIVFCLSGNGKRKHDYASNSPGARVCFADFAGSKWVPAKGDRVFANMFVAAQGYPASLKRFSDHAGFITRGYNIVTRRTWQISDTGGANILSTDILNKNDYSLGGAGHRPLSKLRLLKP